MGGSAQYLMSCLPWPARHNAAKHQRVSPVRKPGLLLSLDVSFQRSPQTWSPADLQQQAMISRPRPFEACEQAHTSLNTLHELRAICLEGYCTCSLHLPWLMRSNNPSMKPQTCIFFSAPWRPLCNSLSTKTLKRAKRRESREGEVPSLFPLLLLASY